VNKGDVIAEFDRQFMLNRLDDYRDSVRQEESGVMKSKAQIEVARVAHEQSLLEAKGDLEKAQLDIKTTPVLGTIDAERLRLALDEAQARYKQLLEEVKYFEASQEAQLRIDELDLEQAKVELKRSEANVDKMIIRAPIDGLTVMMNTFRGGQFDQIKEGDELHSGQPFVQVVDPDSMVINAVVSQTDVEQLRIGQKAKVGFDAFPGLVLPARVYSIGTVAKPGRFRPDFVKEIPVVLRLEKMDPRVIPDLSVSCDVVLESEGGVDLVPREAVFTDRGSQPYVFVRQGPEWQRREVKVGLENYTRVAVQAGLSPGEVIALERPPQVVKKD
jgi:HlyD family secretion protein